MALHRGTMDHTPYSFCLSTAFTHTVSSYVVATMSLGTSSIKIGFTSTRVNRTMPSGKDATPSPAPLRAAPGFPTDVETMSVPLYLLLQHTEDVRTYVTISL